jgi:hypothetical protein
MVPCTCQASVPEVFGALGSHPIYAHQLSWEPPADRNYQYSWQPTVRPWQHPCLLDVTLNGAEHLNA